MLWTSSLEKHLSNFNIQINHQGIWLKCSIRFNRLLGQVGAMGPKCPCMFLLCMLRMQGPWLLVTGPFLRVVFVAKDKVTSLWNTAPPQRTKSRIAYCSLWKQWISLAKCSSAVMQIVSPGPLHGSAVGLGGARGTNANQQHAHAASYTVSNKTLWLRSLVSSVSFHGTVTNSFISLRIG